jgi:hypothetical protein
MFKRGLSPIVQPESVTYKHKKYGTRFKPNFKICGWAHPDGTPVESGKPQPPRIMSGEMNDTIPF